MALREARPLILIICDYYLPGFESGGAMRTLVNMVDRLGDEYRFRVITRDHDGPFNRKPYADVKIDEWNRVGAADVYYLSKRSVRRENLKRLIHETVPDTIYLNSFFSPLTIFTLLLRRFNGIPSIPIILAPEGELVPGGLKLKPIKKQLYITFSKSLNLLHPVIWKVAADSERKDVEMVFGKGKIFIAPNLPPMANTDLRPASKPDKTPGHAKMVFLSRYMRKKNLNWLLERSPAISGDLSIDIYGPIEDVDYWREGECVISSLPDNLEINYKGAVPHDKVGETLEKYHFFVLPTLGENFGHIFVEAMAAGCPLIISDRSPWRQLQDKGVGWDIPLEDPEAWMRILTQCVEMDNDEFKQLSIRARNFAAEWLSDPTLEESNRAVLRFAASAPLID